MYNLEKYNKTQLADIYKMLGNAYIYQAQNEIQKEYLIDIIKDDPETCYKVIRLRRNKTSVSHTLIFIRSILSNAKVYNKYVNNSKVLEESKLIDMKLIIEALPEKKLKRYINSLMKVKSSTELKYLTNYNFGKEKNDIIISTISIKLLGGE